MAKVKRTLCLCGCGGYASEGHKWILYHHLPLKIHPMIGKKHSEESKKKMSKSQKERFKRTGPNKTFGYKPSKELTDRRIKSRSWYRPSEETKAKISMSLMGHPGANKGKHLSEEARRNLSKAAVKRIRSGKRNNCCRGRNGKFYSKKNKKYIHYRSLLELNWFLLLEKQIHVENYCVEPFSIPYIWKKKIHRYIPDLLIHYVNGFSELVEIKPEYDWKSKKNLAKFEAAKNWCKKHNKKAKKFNIVGYKKLEESA